MIATGVVVRIRSTGAQFGLHPECYARFMADLPPEVTDPFTGTVTTIGPLFTPTSQWECAHNRCPHRPAGPPAARQTAR